MLKALATLAITALPTLASAQFIRSEVFRIPVVSLSATTFEVVAADFAGPAQIWCAAAKYSDSRFGRKQKSLWIQRGYGASGSFGGYKSVIFSTKPVGTTSKSLTFGIRSVGLRKSVGSARFLCDDDQFGVWITDRP